MQINAFCESGNIDKMPVELGAIKDWAGVVASLGGAVVGAVIAFVVSTRQSSHQRKIEREKRLLEKFEQLHTLLSKVATEAALCAATLIHRVSSNQEIDPATISGEASIDQLRMLVEFYAPTLVADKATGMALVNAVLAALFHRERSGRGQYVEVPMLETMVAFMLAEHLGGLTFDPAPAKAGYARVLAGGRKPAHC